MPTYKFTNTKYGMLIESTVDVGWQKQLNCGGNMGWECYTPYKADEASVYFGNPYCFTIVGSKIYNEIGLYYDNASVKQVDKYYEDSILTITLEHQPYMVFEAANTRQS